MILATLCYLHRNDHTLRLHRVKKENDIRAGKGNGLGGKFEPGETPEECASSARANSSRRSLSMREMR